MVGHAGKNRSLDTNPKRKRGCDLLTSLTLRVTIVVLALAGSVSRGAEVAPTGKKPTAQPGSADSSQKASSAAAPGAASDLNPAILRAIADLASSEYTVRERGSHALWNAGAVAEPALEKVVGESDDFEAVCRARQILQSFRMGIYADTPPETVEIIVRFRTGSFQVKQLIANRLYAEGKTDFLRRLIAKESNPDFREQLTSILTQTRYGPGSQYRRGFRRAASDPVDLALAARQRLASGDVDSAERLLLHGPLGNEISARDYAALMLSRGKLDAAIAQFRASLNATDEVGQQRLAWMLRAKGDLAGAVAAARLAKDNNLVQDLQAENADWKELAKIDAKANVDVLANVPEGTAKLAQIIAFRHLAGETLACDLASAAALQALKQPQSRDRRLLAALILNDRAVQVVEVSKAEDIRVAFSLLAAQSRLKEAFGLVKIGVPVPTKIDWPVWLKDGKPQADLERLLLAHQVVRALHMAGEEEQARGLIAAVVSAYGATMPQESRELLALDLTELEVRFGRPEAGDAVAAKLLTLDLKDPDVVISTLYRDQEMIAEMVWKTLRKQFPLEDRPTALKHLRRLLADKPNVAAVAELVSLVPRIERQLDAPSAEATSDEEASNPRARRLLALAALLHRVGQGKLATKYLGLIPATGVSAQSLIDQGNLYAEEKAWTDAIKSYTAAFSKDRKSASALYLLGWAQSKHGDEAEGRKRMEQALMIPLGDGESRHDLVQTLVRLHKDDEATRQRQWILRLAPMHDRSIIQTLMEIGDLAAEKSEPGKGDDANMATLWQRVGVELSSVVMAETRYYLQPAFSAHSARARELLRGGKMAEALVELRKAESIQPANLQLALDCDPDLRKYGAAGEADALYGRMLRQHEAFCRDFPKSGTYHNDLAWLAANLDRDLDKALVHAQRAVELEPQSAGILDTLAEVKFRRGDKAEALRLAKRCLEMEPEGEHYKKQLARFER